MTTRIPLLDQIIFSPAEVDLNASPLRRSLTQETFVLGAFNPGLTRLPSGNLLLMVRIAEALRHPVGNGAIHSIRYDAASERYLCDAYPLAEVRTPDPRTFFLRGHGHQVAGLTSLSWLLPVELTPDGGNIVAVHYELAISPHASFQEYGIEDPRISRIDGRYYMTTCCVSSERLATVLYDSDDGLHYRCRGIVLDHQNKDMLLFEGKPGGAFHALTRPLGDVYFAYPPGSEWLPGPSIQLATSPDALHWKPADTPLIRPRKGTLLSARIGGGTPPILTDAGWLLLYHGVELKPPVGIYRTFWALLDASDPSRLLHLADRQPVIEPNPALTAPFENALYLHDVVFSTGIVEEEGSYLVASGEADLLCRLTRLPKEVFTEA